MTVPGKKSEPRNWLARVSGESQTSATPAPATVRFRFGRSAAPSRRISTGKPSARARVSVDDPRVMHGGAAPAIAGKAKKKSAARQVSEAKTTAELIAEVDRAFADVENTVEPMTETHAVARVRKHILTTGAKSGSVGRLIAERFTVGWRIAIPARGFERPTHCYYIADDGEFEQVSMAAESPRYAVEFVRRFWQRRALFG